MMLVALSLAHPLRASEPESRDLGDRAVRHVLALAGTIGPRKTGTEADRLAVEYVRGRMEEAGLSVSLQEVAVAPYADGERSLGSWNVIGRLEGTSSETIVVAAHHDSAGDSIPGANDDASGVAVLLEAARAAARRPHRLTYLFISFCAEEEGLLGSRFYTGQAGLPAVKAMIALE
ncbi:MAG: M28 family peptidase, partial [Acidobacteria bacterium]|nr:M28 family peptidase [Acidobacteriota bacterium]